MQIVIDISEEDYKALINVNDSNLPSIIARRNLYEALKNGTPLPKGHKRLIEDNFEVGPVYDMEGNLTGYLYVTREDLNNAQTIVEADNSGEIIYDK